jgi:nicotinate-nucleotide--dimethylbenzimidazole phosphoribosyltransferase
VSTVAIPALDEAAIEAATARQNSLTKPRGSLGRLEEVAIQLAGIQATERPNVDGKWIVVAAADHGVTAQGVSAFPAEVTPQMVANFLGGGAAINVLSKNVGAEVMIIDCGVAGEVPGPTDGLINRSQGRGTADLTAGPAMSLEQADRAIESGIEVAGDLAQIGAQLVAPGEMGIGNSTSAAAITAVMTGSDVATVAGRGTGIDHEGLGRKIDAITRGLVKNQPSSEDPWGVLSAVGGFEIGFIAGLMLGAASHRIAIVLDGYIATSAALLAAQIDTAVTGYMIAGHRSVEPGHAIALEHLGLQALLELDMRLGEASGAALAMSVIDAAVNLHNGMATFAEASVSNRDE